MRHPAFAQIDHRPWPLPKRRWTWRQEWRDLLFAHWPVKASTLRPLIPEALELDEFDGTAWIGVVPFRMEGVMRRPLPNLPWVSAFPEINVRTYVTHGGKPGVWFFSLDASNPLAVWAARRFFHLPYKHASIDFHGDGEEFRVRSRRREKGDASRLEIRYRPTTDVELAKPGTIEHFLTERYCLYAASRRGRLYRAEVHHVPWPLQRAEAEVGENGVLEWAVSGVGGEPSFLHFSTGVEVVVWGLRAQSGNPEIAR